MVRIYSEGIKLNKSINASDCPFTNDVDSLLNELDYLLRNNLADVNSNDWEDDTPFSDPNELYAFLKAHKPKEDLVFSHGDFGERSSN